MATESYGRTDDGIAWEVRHELWSGPWWWVLTMPDGQRVASPERYETEKQARDAVEDARRQALAGLPPVETMSALRTRAEAAEARATLAEAAGYRRAVDDACAALDAAANELMAGGLPEWGGYTRGRLDGLRDVERDVRRLAPV